jgi:uncharacterized protein
MKKDIIICTLFCLFCFYGEIMKIVLTGGSGIIGKVLTQLLIADGHQLTLFTRSPEKTRNILPGAKDYVKWSSEDESGFEKYLEGSDAVIHLAGTSIFGALWSEDYREKIMASRENGTRHLVNAIKRVNSKPSVFISASAIGIYGFSEVITFTEESSAGEGFLPEVSKKWEHEAAQIKSENIREVRVRVGIVLDKEEGALGAISTPFKYFLGGTIGNGNQWVSWIHNRDAARVFIYALKNRSLEGPVNAVAPSPVRMKEFADVLGDVLSRPALLTLPKFPLDAVLDETAKPVTEGIKVLPDRLLRNGFEFEFTDLRAALTDILV